MADLIELRKEWTDAGGHDLEWEVLNLAGLCDAFVSAVCDQMPGESDPGWSNFRYEVMETVKDLEEPEVSNAMTQAELFFRLRAAVEQWHQRMIALSDAGPGPLKG